MILLVNVWLGYPYCMRICRGSKSIAHDLYEARPRFAGAEAARLTNFFRSPGR